VQVSGEVVAGREPLRLGERNRVGPQRERRGLDEPDLPEVDPVDHTIHVELGDGAERRLLAPP